MPPSPRPSRSPTFAVVALWVLCILSIPGFLLTLISHSIDRPPGFNVEVVFLYALPILPVLALASIFGLKASAPWAYWTGLAGFGIPVMLGILILLQIAVPGIKHLMGGLVDPDWWPLAPVLLAWALPGASLWHWRRRQKATVPSTGDESLERRSAL